MNAIEKALTRLERGIVAAVKNVMQKAPEELSAYTLGFLRSSGDSKNDGLTVSDETKRRYFEKPNKKGRLRSLYGNIERSVTVGGKGNISEVELKGGKVVIASFGYEPTTSVTAGPYTTTLRYAALHEGIEKSRIKPKRPFVRPGFELYMKDAQGFKALMKELEADILELA